MKILILGKGLVGTHLAEYLQGKGHTIAVASRSGADFNIDLSDYTQYNNAFGHHHFDVVVCCAVSYSDFLPDALQNVLITTNAMAYFKEKAKQVIFVSSFSALEENKHQSPYNFTKYLAEEITQEYAQNTCSLRFSQIIDLAEGSRNAQRGFHYFIDAIKNNQPLNIFVKNDTPRSYISVEYVCEAIEYAMENQLVGFHNIVLEPKLSLQELSHLLLEQAPDYTNEVSLIDKEAISYHIPNPSECFVDFSKKRRMEDYLKQFIKKQQ